MADVLVIEASDTIRAMLVRGLQMSGLNPVGVTYPEDAIAACVAGQKQPDLIIASCRSGDPADLVKLITPLRDNPSTRRIPLLIAADDPAIAIEAKKLGACDCLVRSWVEFRKLAECVRRNLGPITSKTTKLLLAATFTL